MSTELTNRTFFESSSRGLLSGILDRVRINLRDAVGAVRIEAAWYTWPMLHRASKALHERLITHHDRLAEKGAFVEAAAKRLSLMYPSADRFPYQRDPERMRESLALEIGMSAEKSDNLYMANLDEVLVLYHDKYADNPQAEATTPETEYEGDMNNWNRLNAAVGGDLFSNPRKLAIMRQVDSDPVSDHLSWDEFSEKVCQQINASCENAEPKPA